ncbi:hypothetical protein [Microbaculum marinum]|uniref:Uncharacterized protein n=1 Tax=Microbaculum marinum TaxID=1764581 RepID=A0AAW9RU12_9HYPH
MRSFVHLLVAIALVMGTAHVLRQTGMFVEAKRLADRGSLTDATAYDLQRFSGRSGPVILGNQWFQSKVRAACPDSGATFIRVHPSYFDNLAAVVEQLGLRTTSPVVVQLGNRTWFPNRRNTQVRLDYLPAAEWLSLRQIWRSTGLMYQLAPDVLRLDPSRQSGPANDYLLAAADLNGLSELLDAVRAQPGDFHLVTADPKPLKGITDRQKSRQKQAIEDYGDEGLYKSINVFAKDTGCAPLAAAAPSRDQTSARVPN